MYILYFCTNLSALHYQSSVKEDILECEKKILRILPLKAGSSEDQQECLKVPISSQSSFRIKPEHETPRDKEEMPAIIFAEHSGKSATVA